MRGAPGATFSTPTARRFVRGHREKTVLATEPGKRFSGVPVSDFFATYTSDVGGTNTAGRI